MDEKRRRAELLALGVMVHRDPTTIDLLREDDFMFNDTRDLFLFIQSLRDKGKPINSSTIALDDDISANALKAWSDCGDDLKVSLKTEDAISQVFAQLARVSDLNYIATEAARLSNAIQAQRLRSVDEAINEMQIIQESAMQRHRITTEVTIGDTVRDALHTLQENARSGRIRSGYPMLDSYIGGGFVRGEYVLIAARTNVGKSILAMLMALNAAREGHSVLLCTNEMTRDQLGARAISAISGVSMSVVEQSSYGTQVDYENMAKAVKILGRLPIVTLESCYSVSQIANALERRQRAGIPVSFVVLDHVQRMKSDNPKVVKEYETVTEASRAIQALAIKYKVVFITMAQINRAGAIASQIEISDIKSSGALEEDPDKVFLLYGDKKQKYTRVLKLGKNRRGRAGDEFRFTFDGARMRFTELKGDE